ncbi:MAG: glycosyltransferase family 2 protein [Proteobacteria bacterium]|jgi:glycosyltransferase involved in cell wall biosynthesis|nr:glycosyltransferase family 2 protein [Pseudomonadota bacterium]
MIKHQDSNNAPRLPLLIFVPCYQCEAHISGVLLDLKEHLADSDVPSRILVIDNSSTDRTISQCLAVLAEDPWLAKSVTVYRNKMNVGLGGSHKLAFLLAIKWGFSRVFVFHGDHQAQAKDLLPLINASRKTERTVIGSRFSRGSSLTGYSKIRIVGNWMVNWAYSILLGHKIEDVGSGLNSYSMSDISKLNFQNLPNDFTFNMGLTIDLALASLTPEYLPIHWRHIDQVSHAKIFKVGWKSLSILARKVLTRSWARQEPPVNLDQTEEISLPKKQGEEKRQ